MEFEWQKPSSTCYLCARQKGIKYRATPYPEKSCAVCFEQVCATHHKDVRSRDATIPDSVLSMCSACAKQPGRWPDWFRNGRR